MKLIIAGSRTLSTELLENIFTDFPRFCHQIVSEIHKEELTEIVHGGCKKGTDQFANREWDEYWDIIPTTIFSADWDTHGKAAGHIRNKEMAEYADALLLIWDGESKGSKNMKENMIKLKKPVYEVILKINKYNSENHIDK